MKKYLFIFGLGMMFFSVKAQTCAFPTCIRWYENGQCEQTTCETCSSFLCNEWYKNGQCLTGLCQPSCEILQCDEWYENGQCKHAGC